MRYEHKSEISSINFVFIERRHVFLPELVELVLVHAAQLDELLLKDLDRLEEDLRVDEARALLHLPDVTYVLKEARIQRDQLLLFAQSRRGVARVVGVCDRRLMLLMLLCHVRALCRHVSDVTVGVGAGAGGGGVCDGWLAGAHAVMCEALLFLLLLLLHRVVVNDVVLMSLYSSNVIASTKHRLLNNVTRYV